MTSKEKTIRRIDNLIFAIEKEKKENGRISLVSKLDLEYLKEVLKVLEQKEYTDRKNVDLLETIECFKQHAFIRKNSKIGTEIIVSFHSSDDDFEKVGWVFDIIKY